MANPFVLRMGLALIFASIFLWHITVVDEVFHPQNKQMSHHPSQAHRSSTRLKQQDNSEDSFLQNMEHAYIHQIDSQQYHVDVSRSNPSSNANLPNSKELPTLNANGDMIIYFLHIPKTGGTTLTSAFRRSKLWRYRMVLGSKKQIPYVQEMYETLQNWKPGTKIFYEHHAGPSDPYMAANVRKDLHNWRDMATKQGIPFFAFTLVREPLSFALSHFNFYYANRMEFGDHSRFYYVENPTETDFLNLSLPNPQCLFCVHSELAYHAVGREDRKSSYVPKERCDDVYDAFALDLDWIGTTETMSNETFHILAKISQLKFRKKLVINKSEAKISKSSLSQEAIDHIRNITSYDQAIYERAKRDYPFDMWSKRGKRKA